MDQNFEFGKVKLVMLKGEKGDSGDVGDYAGLSNKPKINNVEVSGNKSASDFGLVGQTQLELLTKNVNESLYDEAQQLAEMQEQMDMFIADHAGNRNETVLWEGNLYKHGDTITIDDLFSNYDYIEVWQSGGDITKHNAADDEMIELINFFETGSTGIILEKVNLIPAVNNDSIEFSFDLHHWEWSGQSGESAEIIQPSVGDSADAIAVTKIVGVKFQSDAELVDMRVGYDGTVYPSAGAALRGQILDALSKGVTSDIKEALLACFEHVAWVDDQGQTYYDALEDALYPPVPAVAISLNVQTLNFNTLNNTQQLTATLIPADATDEIVWESSDDTVATVSDDGLVTAVAYGSATITATAGQVSATCAVVISPATLESISAVYTQSGTVYNTNTLDSLKSDLVVTAYYDNETSATVPSADYTLSGTLTVGTSTITVSYGGKTTTFTVTVTEYVDTSIHNWDFTQSLTDSVGSVTATLSDSGASRDSAGLHITSASGYCMLGDITEKEDLTIEVDIASMSRQGSNHSRLLMKSISGDAGTGDGLIYNKSGYWATYFGSWSPASSSGITDPNVFANKTLKFVYSKTNGYAKLYVDNELILTRNSVPTTPVIGWQIGSSSNSYYNVTITGLRIYDEV